MKVPANNSILPVDEFRVFGGTILDVRSPIEFEKGHIPGAVNFPLFSNDERKMVGIKYKRNGRNAAINLGYELVGPKLGEIVSNARELVKENKLRINCWRGGMRSKSITGLLRNAGIEAVMLEKGYKAYRNWALKLFLAPGKLIVLHGLTGTGKTEILYELAKLGEQVLDLEGLANHRGSVFGGLGMPGQPSTQQFQNLIAEKLAAFDPNKRIWAEAESPKIGSCWLPENLVSQMRASSSVEIVRNVEDRLDIITSTYGVENKDGLIEATMRLKKRLGGERTKIALGLIENGDLREASRLILDYYDKSYRNNLNGNGEYLFIEKRKNASHFCALKLIEMFSAAKTSVGN